MGFRYIILLISTLLLAYLLYNEYKRANKKLLVWRIIANILTVSCLVCLFIPITYEKQLQQNRGEIILLTEGVQSKTISNLKEKKYTLLRSNLKDSSTTFIPDLNYFLETHPEIRKINIYGYGIPVPTLKNLSKYELAFYLPSYPTGIISVGWQPKLKTGEQLIIQGSYQNNSTETIKLLLKGFGHQIDSVSIAPNTKQPFSFKNYPKQLGNAIYQLISIQSGDTLAKEPVPFRVENQAQMKILILASFPDFEYKFLKNWLYENEYLLAFRSKISKDKFTFDFLNMDSMKLNTINASVLKRFDLLIIDEEELTAIDPNERSAINQAVDNGMGLLMRIGSTKVLSPISNNFLRFELQDTKGKSLSLRRAEDHFKLDKLPLEQTLFLKNRPDQQSLIEDQNSRILVSSGLKGYGKVVVTAVPSTYNWVLSGKKLDYTSYWSYLIAKSGRRKKEAQSINIIPRFPVVNQKTRFIVDLDQSSLIPQLIYDSWKLSPKQNMELPFQWEAVFWPQEAGWHNFLVNQHSEPLYIYQERDWQAFKNQELININQQFSKNGKSLHAKDLKNNLIIKEEISKWWFFIGFLFAIGFLWFEARLLG